MPVFVQNYNAFVGRSPYECCPIVTPIRTEPGRGPIYKHKTIPRGVLRDLYISHPELRSELKENITWSELEMRLAASNMDPGIVSKISAHYEVVLDRDHGLCVSEGLSTEQKEKLDERLLAWNREVFDDMKDLRLYLDDIIVLRATFTNHLSCSASAGKNNVIILFPRMFTYDLSNNFNSRNIVSTSTELNSLFQEPWAAYILFHELTHTFSVLATSDQTILKAELQELKEAAARHEKPRNLSLPIWNAAYTPEPDSTATAYGHAGCLSLAKLDKVFGTSRAEENADSWAVLAALYFMTIKYPEYDFGGTKSVTERAELAYHCSLFDCLRSSSIKNLAKYDAKQDVWAKEHGDSVPENVSELVQVLTDMLKDKGIGVEAAVPHR